MATFNNCTEAFEMEDCEDKLMYDLQESIDKATDLLISKRFEKCIDTCNTVIYRGKDSGLVDFQSQPHASPVMLVDKNTPLGKSKCSEGIQTTSTSDDKQCDSTLTTSTESRTRTDKYEHRENKELMLTNMVNSAVVLSIQAHAELNQWNDVIPFVRRVYGAIENCPAKIMQLCLLLHAKVKEYLQCHALAKIWLQSEQNYKGPVVGYKEVVELYVSKILIPTQKHELIQKAMDSSWGLTPNEKETMIAKFQKCVKIDCDAQTQVKKSSESVDKCGSLTQHGHNESESTDLLDYGSAIFRKILQTLTREKLKKLWKVILMAVVAIFAFLHTQYGDFTTNINRAMVVWQGILKVFNSMFGYDDP